MNVPGFGSSFRLTLLTKNADLASAADRAGVDRIGVDLERLGKAERQAGHDTRLSYHGWNDLALLATCISRADLFIRINPIHPGTVVEVEKALELGAKVIMLPSFRTAEEVSIFVAAVRGRAQVIILVELAPAVTRIRDILDVAGVDEVMLGLNDLHLQLGVANHFEVLASPVVDMLAAEVRRKGLPLSVGGLGRVSDADLPIPPALVYAQYPRLGASGAWISRSFVQSLSGLEALGGEIQELRASLQEWSTTPPAVLEMAREDLARAASHWNRKEASHLARTQVGLQKEPAAAAVGRASQK